MTPSSPSGDAWDPLQYDKFRAERQQPFFDLLALMRPAPEGRVVDLGCGTGELTVLLHERLEAAETIGIERSAAMLADCERFAAPGVSFSQRVITTFPSRDGADGVFDVIAANASLQWVPDHDELLDRLCGALAPGGQLAFQVPANGDHPSHWLAEVVAQEARFAEALADGAYLHRSSVLAPEAYAVALHDLGFTEQVVRLQVYGHLLASADDVVEWVKGTLLTPYRERLESVAERTTDGGSAGSYDAFLNRYRELLRAELGDQRPYFYPFKRILCWGRRP